MPFNDALAFSTVVIAEPASTLVVGFVSRNSFLQALKKKYG